MPPPASPKSRRSSRRPCSVQINTESPGLLTGIRMIGRSNRSACPLRAASFIGSIFVNGHQQNVAIAKNHRSRLLIVGEDKTRWRRSIADEIQLEDSTCLDEFSELLYGIVTGVGGVGSDLLSRQNVRSKTAQGPGRTASPSKSARGFGGSTSSADRTASTLQAAS